MIYAYDEIYVADAMENLGEAFEYASISLNVGLEDFMKLFIATGFAKEFGGGNPKVIAGLSGTELAMEVLSKSGLIKDFPDAIIDYEASPEFWCGYIIAYYQWETGKSFREINKEISMDEVMKLYSTLHEASERKFVETVDARIAHNSQISNLQRQRKICGYTQKELSDKTGVNLRTLQQYETGAKDLGNAAINTVLTLADALSCSPESILQTEYESRIKKSNAEFTLVED